MSNAAVVNSLKQSDIFYQFTPTQLELVANICHEATYQKDDLIFKENTGSKELYIVIQGEVDIVVDPSLVGLDGSYLNPRVKSFLALQEGILGAYGIHPLQEVSVRLTRGTDDYSSSLDYVDGNGWVSKVGLKSACSAGFLAYFENSVRQRQSRARSP